MENRSSIFHPLSSHLQSAICNSTRGIMTLRFAYSTINWGDTCDLGAALAEIRQAGWRAVELFGHTLDWLGPREELVQQLGGMAAATLFGGIEVPTSARQL